MMRRLIHHIKDFLFPPYRDISDEYINRLFCANAGMLHRGNLLAFDYAVRHLPQDSVLLEIGSYAGLSTNAIIYYLQKHRKNNPFFTCDSWEFFGEKDARPPSENYLNQVGERADLSRESYMNFVKDGFIQNLQFFSGARLPYAIHAHSEKFMSSWTREAEMEDIFGRKVKSGGKIGFCFLDGDHTLEGAERDFSLIEPYLASGGLILLDDSADGTRGSRNSLGKKLKNHPGYSLIMKNPNYLFMKK